jgi:hypothetical protein
VFSFFGTMFATRAPQTPNPQNAAKDVNVFQGDPNTITDIIEGLRFHGINIT